MRRDRLHLVPIVLLLATGIALTALAPLGRGMLAALVLLTPGYLLAAAVLPPGVFGFPERLVAALGFSFSTIALLGLALNLLPWGLQPVTWLAGLAVVSAVPLGMLVAQGRLRRTRLPRWHGGRGQMVGWLSSVLAGAVTIFVLVGNHADATVQREGGFTQLWLLPGSSGGASLGVTSDENATFRYDVDVVTGARVLRRWPGLSLRPGETWQATLAAADLRGIHGRLEARLYRDDRPGVIYRYVTLWIGAGQGQAGPAAAAGTARTPAGGQSPPPASPPLRVDVQPAAVPIGGSLRLAISSAPATLIRCLVSYPGLAPSSFTERTDSHGRLVLPVTVPDSLPVGDSLQITVRATVQGRPVQAARSVRLLAPVRIPLAAALSVDLPLAGFQPGVQAPLLVRYSPHVLVQVKVSFPGAAPISLSGETDGNGQLALTIAVPVGAAGRGSGGTALLVVRAMDVRGPVEVTRTVPIEQGLEGP